MLSCECAFVCANAPLIPVPWNFLFALKRQEDAEEAILMPARTPTRRKLSHSACRNLNARCSVATIRPVHGGYSSVG